LAPSPHLERRTVLYPDGLLRDEPRFLLSQESRLRNIDTYISCLRAIAAGTTRLNAIAQRIGRARSEEARHFRFVAPRESRLHPRARRPLLATVLPQLDKFVSEDAFERVCQGWLLARLDGAVEAGRWWGSIRRREQGALRSRAYAADVVALDAGGKALALGSCRWADG
jgi:hypothetical protein